MNPRLKVLLASRSKPVLADLYAKLTAENRYELHTRHMENGHADPLYGLRVIPDVVVMMLTDRGHHDLLELTKEQLAHRPPMIVTAEGTGRVKPSESFMKEVATTSAAMAMARQA